MRISTRLVLTLGGTILVVMIGYMIVSYRQRKAILDDSTVQTALLLTRTLQSVANDAVRDGRIDDLDRVLDLAHVADREEFASLVLDDQGRPMAGGAEDLECLLRRLPRPLPPEGTVSGWTRCGDRLHWAATRVAAPAGHLIVARRSSVLNRSVQSALRRQLLLTLVLTAAIGVSIIAVLKTTLSRPVEEIVRGLRALATPGAPTAIRVPESAGELALVARTVNEMAEQLERQRLDLLREVEERLALQERLQKSEKLAVVGRLSGGLAHELGSPLSVISICSEVIQSWSGAPEAIRQRASTISVQVDRMTSFIHGLLHVSRGQGVVYDPLDLREVAKLVQADTADLARSSGAEVEVSTPDGAVTVGGDATLLRHALGNLVRNSVQALRAHPGDRRIGMRVRRGGYDAIVVVEDTGPGIPEEHLEHIFEPFYTTKGVGEGVGLGLPISRGILEEHGGELRLENRAGGGVRITLSLPLLDPVPAGAA